MAQESKDGLVQNVFCFNVSLSFDVKENDTMGLLCTGIRMGRSFMSANFATFAHP